jgi:hypothetical protein
MNLQDAGSIATIAGTALAVVAIGVGLYQIRQIGKVEKESNKANVSVRFEYGVVREGKAVFLVFENHGKATAKGVRLDFPANTKWHFVAHPSSFPFQKSGGILSLYPGAKLQYFVGRPLARSPFETLKTTSIQASLSFKDDVKGDHVEQVSLTLQDQTFVAK